MLGTLVNTGAVIIGGAMGLLVKKQINEKLSTAIMTGLGLCVLYIGITGSLKGENALIAIISIAVGSLIGELSDLDRHLKNFGDMLEEKLSKGKGSSNISLGFVSASLLFCVGAMSIVGSLQSGLSGNHETLFTKSLLDFVAAIVFASSMGAGVILSAAVILIYQGSITLLAQFISPYLTQSMINEMTCVGSLLIIALSLNMIGVTKIKVMNYVPAIFLPILLCLFIK